jgi:hypothetical protein
VSEGDIRPENGIPRNQVEINHPSKEAFQRRITFIAEGYRKDFVESERFAKSHGLKRIRSNPNLAEQFYEAQGRIAGYKSALSNLGQYDLLNRLNHEIKQELAR